jgi:NAD-dependent deacetylase
MKDMKNTTESTQRIKSAENDFDALTMLLLQARHAIAFTGAGVSTFSGIQDFRGKNGLYKTENANKIFDLAAFQADPSFYYSKTRDFIYGLDEKKPSIVHNVLAELERRGVIHAVITQNVDLLHQKAGSKHVIEIHGSPEPHRCMRCGWTMSFVDAAAVVHKGQVPQRALAEAMSEAKAADLMLVLGSSLTVYPAASLPEWTLEHGGDIVIVNDMPTHLDDHARLHFSELGSVFQHLAKSLE